MSTTRRTAAIIFAVLIAGTVGGCGNDEPTGTDPTNCVTTTTEQVDVDSTVPSVGGDDGATQDTSADNNSTTTAVGDDESGSEC